MKASDESSSDYEWAIGMTKLGLKVCGVWPNIRRPNWLRMLISIRVTIATLIVMIFTIIPGLFALVKVWGNMTLIIDNLIITLPFFTAIFKLNVLWAKEEEVQKLFDDISEDWSRPRSEIERNIMVKTATVARNVTIFAYILVIWVILIHHLPLWVAGIVPRTPTNLTDGTRALVMQTIYFYDETLTPTFEITATCQFLSSLVAGSSYTTIDCVFGALILHVSGQLQVLEVKVQNLCNHYDKATKSVDKILFQKDLNSVAKAHQRVILFVKRMENIFCMMLLEQFTAFAIIFATEGFNVISSTKIYHAAYNSEWVNLKTRDMYQIIMIINRAQKPLIVTAGKFAPISLSTFAKCDPDFPQPCCYYNTTCIPNKANDGYFMCIPEGMRKCDTPNCIANNLEFGSNVLKHMDAKVNPCDNFYQFACGNYASFPATSRKVRFSNHLQKVRNDKSIQLDEAITKLLSSSTQFKPYKIVRTLFDSCQDVKTNNQNTNGLNSLETLESIVSALGDWPVLLKNWQSDFNWMEFISKAQNLGFSKLSFLYAQVLQNNFDGSLQIRVSPPDLEHSGALLKSTKRYSELLEAYTIFMTKVAEELGAEESRSREDLLESLAFELKLAEAVTKEPPTLMTLSELESKWPGIQWMDLFQQLFPDFVINSATPVQVENPKFVTKLEQELSQTPKRVQANYAVWKIIQKSIHFIKSPSLSRLIRTYWHQVFPNYALPPIDCVEFVKHFLPFSIYSVFIREHGDIHAKSEATEFVDKIANELGQVFEGVDWFDESTRKKADDKVKYMTKIVGYINMLADNVLKEFYESLEISGDCLKNYQNLNLFIMRNKIRIVKKPFYFQNLLDVFTYYHIPVLTSYSARYLPNKNVIEISPSILQGFFFNIDRPNYINYGRAGTLIGHEMGHAFDTQNRYLDKNGFHDNWWTEATNNTYLEKIKCFIEKCNLAAEKLGVKINGSRCVDENLADSIGVRVAYSAYQDYLKQNGADPILPELALYSNNQLFWLSYASQWCSLPQNSVGNNRYLSNDLRVVATVANIPEFSQDFKCPVGSNMNPVDKCKLF
ncbi:neprilysin-2-like isoform X3 [Cotesia glomerata]|uniref:neprilysin-2-like isoform X3 n=1 Tax=Cotesia glomerata TaxID=32391 RepID=UPI001D00ADCB|nr:neprilysin-2-like isoform X3 [Cotesia glomerata]